MIREDRTGRDIEVSAVARDALAESEAAIEASIARLRHSVRGIAAVLDNLRADMARLERSRDLLQRVSAERLLGPEADRADEATQP